MTKYEGILFDCDGTLIDSEDHYQTILDLVSLKHNLKSRNPYQHIGLSLADLWPQIGGHEHPLLTFEQWKQDLEECYRKSLQKNNFPCPLRPYVKLLLKELRTKRSIKIGCASNSPRKYVINHLAQEAVILHVHLICAKEDVTHPKPHPEPYLTLCKHLKVDPQYCLAVEDSPIGIRSAKEAGLTVVAFPHKYTQKADLSLADYIINDIRDIMDILELPNTLKEAA